MGIINWLMHRNMKNVARSIVNWAVDSYSSINKQCPGIIDREIFGRMLDQRGEFPGGDRDREIILDRYGSSINGICYYLGLNSQSMRGTMVSRCIQFTEYIDLELKNRGFEKPANDIKKGYFKTLGLPENAVEEKYI